MRKWLLTTVCLAMSAGFVVPSADARTRKQELSYRETYDQDDAIKGRAHIEAAMTLPMEQMIRAATLNNPEAMLRYGLALELGRAPATHLLGRGDRDALKAGYRAMTDLYLNSSDKFDIKFNEDAMLDEPEFWIYLAKHIGRKQQLPPGMFMQAEGGGGNTPAGSTFFKVDEPEKELNLNRDLILQRQMVNAATACVSSAAAFAKMKKAQTVDLTEAKVPTEAHSRVRSDAARVYKLSYQQGQMACGSVEYFFKVADYATANLGAYGHMKDDPSATVASLGDVPIEP